MNKKIFLSLLAVLFSFTSLNVFAGDLYVTKNGTGVFIDPNKNHKYLFWEGYKVADTGEFYQNFRKVILTDGTKAFIHDTRLSSYLDDIYILKSDSAELLAAKFPLFVEPNAKGEVKKVLYRGAKLYILNKNLINKVWVRVQDSQGTVGYIWYKTLDFSNMVDNSKKSLSSLKIREDNILNEGTYKNRKTQNYNIGNEIIKAKQKNYNIYLSFLEKLDDLKRTAPQQYNAVISQLKVDSPSTYNDILMRNKKESSPSTTDDSTDKFLDAFFGGEKEKTQNKDFKKEIEELEKLDTDDFLNELFK